MATIPSRSFDLGRVLSTGFNALFKNAVPFFGVSLILAGIPGFMINYWLLSAAGGVVLAPGEFNEASLNYMLSWQFWGPILVGGLVAFLATALLQGTLIGATVRHLSGRPVDIGQSVSSALGRVIPIILLSLLVGLVIMFGLILLIVPGIIFYLMYIVSVPVMMAEGQGISASMSRSAELTKGSRPMIFLLAIVMVMISGGVSAVCNAIFVRLAEVSGGAAADVITLSVGTLVEQTIVTAISAVLIAALYVELRAVKEGATTEGIADVFS